MQIDRNRYLTMHEVADRSGYSYGHIRKLVKDGVIQVVHIDSRTRLIDWESLEQYIKEKPQRKPHQDK